jgi:endonuclease YncB( thermonuclease family)
VWDKYGGRVDGLVRDLRGLDVAAQLVADGWASLWDGRGPAPTPAWPRVER